MEELWRRLDLFLNNSEANITQDKYFTMCEQLGEEPDPGKIPPELNNFPDIVQKALILFNKLGDRVFPDIGYLGKDYTNLPILMDIYEIDNPQIFMETLLRLDSRIIQKSAAALKAERDKIRRASKK